MLPLIVFVCKICSLCKVIIAVKGKTCSCYKTEKDIKVAVDLIQMIKYPLFIKLTSAVIGVFISDISLNYILTFYKLAVFLIQLTRPDLVRHCIIFPGYMKLIT